MIYIGLKEALSSWKGELASAMLGALIGYVVGNFWMIMTGKPEYLVYLLVGEAVLFNRPKLAREISKMIRTGAIDTWLTWPGTLYWKIFGIFVGRALVSTTLTLVLVSPLLLIYGFPNLLYAPLILLSFLMTYSLSAIVGYLAFWMGDSRPIDFVFDKFYFLLSGILVPLEFFPPWLASVASVLPFRFMGIFPIKAMYGQFVVADLLGALFWAAFLMAAAMAVEKIGVKKYEVVGG